VIREEGFDFKVMLGLDMAAEMSNPHCPWGAEFSAETIASNCERNHQEIERAIALANRYNGVFSVSVGNEATVEWTDHMVPVERLISHVRELKEAIKQPITFCDNYAPWTYKLEPLVCIPTPPGSTGRSTTHWHIREKTTTRLSIITPANRS
jgi:hypothetical protein